MLPTRAHTGIRYIQKPPKKPVYRKSVKYRAIELWNNLKPQYVKADCYKTFKVMVVRDFPTCFTVPIKLSDI